MRRSRHYLRAFTLIEIVVVLVLIAISASLAAPSLRGWGQGAKLRDATQQLLDVAQSARSTAIARGMTHRLELDATTNSYRVTVLDGTTYAPATGEIGSAITLPAGFTLKLMSGGADGRSVQFEPTARTTPAVIRVTSGNGETSDLVCAFPADLFRRALTATGRPQ